MKAQVPPHMSPPPPYVQAGRSGNSTQAQLCLLYSKVEKWRGCASSEHGKANLLCDHCISVTHHAADPRVNKLTLRLSASQSPFPFFPSPYHKPLAKLSLAPG